MKALNVYKNTKIYIIAPAKIATGGPELLHQLAYNLRTHLNIDTYIYYIPTKYKNPVHENYIEYSIPYTKNIIDKEENILISPEIKLCIDLLDKFKKIRKAIWWLSVDNYKITHAVYSKKHLLIKNIINRAFHFVTNKNIFDIQEEVLKNKNDFWQEKSLENLNVNVHLCQSRYAIDFLIKNGINTKKIYYLSDYLNQNFLKTQTNISKKEDIVAYNPQKGYLFTKKLIKKAPEINFIPLINMSRTDIIKTLQRSKVYIDFGHHPGKDRLPREAAILGCCVITGKRGAASYSDDIPIPERYKFEDKEENIQNIIFAIKYCFCNYTDLYNEFKLYREIIKNEYPKFIKELLNIFSLCK